MWERFSYYGMRSLLILYMVEFLLKPDQAKEVFGLGILRNALQSVVGPLSDQAFASQIYGFYTGLVYLTPILGGILADRIIGSKATVMLGAALMVAGHLLMAADRLFLLALMLLIIGVGMFKPNTTTQVGELYRSGDTRVDRAYSIFYVGINIGAFLAPLVCGFLGEEIAWSYGFVSAGFGMAIGMATYLFGLPFMPQTKSKIMVSELTDKEPKLEMSPFIRLLILFVPSALFWCAYEQQGNTIALWTREVIDRRVNLIFWHGEIPVSWFQSLNPILIFVLSPILIECWARLSRRGREPTTIRKLITGLVVLSLAYLSLAALASLKGPEHFTWVWLLPYFVLLTLSELHFSPIGLSLVSSLAPPRHRASLMAVWFTSIFVGNLLAGTLGGLWSGFSHSIFFFAIATLSAVGAVYLVMAQSSLKRVRASEIALT